MDIKNTAWFGQMQMTGVAKTVNAQGSVLMMVGEFLTQLRVLNPRELAEGKTITFTFSTNPIGTDKAKNDRLALVNSVADSLAYEPNHVDMGPAVDEPIDSYVQRLVASGHSSVSARFIAADWYGIEDGEAADRLREWLEDPKAVRFRLLNSSSSAFESAHPTEYRQLLDELEPRFGAFIDAMQLRIAR